MKPIIGSLLALGMVSAAQASLWVDFNSTTQDGGPHNDVAYQAYDAGHEVAADFVTKTYSTTFVATGAADVDLTPAWPSTTDNRVQQMIDRGAANDGNWAGSNLDLLTDFIGIDTRTSAGGLGNWDGTVGTPTYMTFTLAGLAASTYNYRSFHHDTENVWSNYTVEISTDGGGTYGAITIGGMTSSTATGNPSNPSPATTGTPETLSSTFNTSFTTDGSDVVIRYATLADTAVHRQIFAVNGIQLSQVPEPSVGLLGLLGLGLVARRRR